MIMLIDAGGHTREWLVAPGTSQMKFHAGDHAWRDNKSALELENEYHDAHKMFLMETTS